MFPKYPPEQYPNSSPQRGAAPNHSFFQPLQLPSLSNNPQWSSSSFFHQSAPPQYPYLGNQQEKRWNERQQIMGMPGGQPGGQPAMAGGRNFSPLRETAHGYPGSTLPPAQAPGYPQYESDMFRQQGNYQSRWNLFQPIHFRHPGEISAASSSSQQPSVNVSSPHQPGMSRKRRSSESLNSRRDSQHASRSAKRPVSSLLPMLNGERRLIINFENYGTKMENNLQTCGKNGNIVIPHGVVGSHTAYGENWKFEIYYKPSPTIDKSETSSICVPLTWKITNLTSGAIHLRTETMAEAKMRMSKGRTISNRVFRDAMEHRARQLEMELVSEQQECRRSNLESRIARLRPRKFSEGSLIFGLQHRVIQEHMQGSLFDDAEGVAAVEEAEVSGGEDESIDDPEASNMEEEATGKKSKVEDPIKTENPVKTENPIKTDDQVAPEEQARAEVPVRTEDQATLDAPPEQTNQAERGDHTKTEEQDKLEDREEQVKTEGHSEMNDQVKPEGQVKQEDEQNEQFKADL